MQWAHAIMVPLGCISSMPRLWAALNSQSSRQRQQADTERQRQTLKASRQAGQMANPTADSKAKVMHNQHAAVASNTPMHHFASCACNQTICSSWTSTHFSKETCGAIHIAALTSLCWCSCKAGTCASHVCCSLHKQDLTSCLCSRWPCKDMRQWW